MNSNNGWYSVFDAENRPSSGEEVLCLAMLDDAVNDEDPLGDQDNRVYYIATWYKAGDLMFEESPEPDPSLSVAERIEARIFGSDRPAPEDGFYVSSPELFRRKDTKGGSLPAYGIIYRQHRLKLHGEGLDGLIAWQPLTWPLEE